MALNNFSKLSPRSQSSLVSQIHKMIGYYGEVFCARERVYLKSISKDPKQIYWLESEGNKIVAVTLVEPDYSLEASGIKLITVGHTIAKQSGQMNRILSHIWNDYEDCSIALIVRPMIAEAIDTSELKVKVFSSQMLLDMWPELAKVKSDYFNVKSETLDEGLRRKKSNIYIYLCDKDKAKIADTKPGLVRYLESRDEV